MANNPLETAEQIAKRLHPYCTILLKLFRDDNGQKSAIQIGSGTYVRIGQVYGILTVFHCTELLTGEYLLGLNAAPEANEHNFVLERKSIQIIPVATPKSEEYGPDLAFITIADWNKISTIKASKSFYDLTKERDHILNEPPPDDRSLWYVCGVPNERLVTGISQAGYDQMFEFQELCGAGGIDRVFTHEGYDYSEMNILSAENDPPPSTFGGMSGGGLWQVPWPPSDTSTDPIPDYFLSGVIFYQGRTDEGVRFLRCHFRESIYRNVIDAVG